MVSQFIDLASASLFMMPQESCWLGMEYGGTLSLGAAFSWRLFPKPYFYRSYRMVMRHRCCYVYATSRKLLFYSASYCAYKLASLNEMDYLQSC